MGEGVVVINSALCADDEDEFYVSGSTGPLRAPFVEEISYLFFFFAKIFCYLLKNEKVPNLEIESNVTQVCLKFSPLWRVIVQHNCGFTLGIEA